MPSGLIWCAPGSGPVARSHAGYHWQGLVWLAGNLYLLTGLALLAGAVAAAARCRPGRRTAVPERIAAVPFARAGN